MKTCTKCHVELLLTEFYSDKRSRDGYQSQCRACYAAWRAAHREEERARAAAWYAANPERDRARGAAYRAANPEKKRAHNLKRKYGMTLAEHADLLERQGGLCAIRSCGLPATCIDHCHDCEGIDQRGAVRGILCHPCNRYLDHIARFAPAHAAYLAVHNAVCPARAVTA